jgi:actin-related protein
MSTPWAVLDVGSYTTKAGKGGFSTPEVILPSLIEWPPTGQVVGFAPRRMLTGYHALAERDTLPIIEPMKQCVERWDAWASLAHSALNEHLCLDISETRLMFIERVDTPTANREKSTQIAFEEWLVEGYYAVKHSDSACFALSLPTGIIIDIGHYSSSLCVHGDGYEYPHLRKRLNVGGKVLQDLLKHQLASQGIRLRSFSASDYSQQLRRCIESSARFYINKSDVLSSKSSVLWQTASSSNNDNGPSSSTTESIKDSRIPVIPEVAGMQVDWRFLERQFFEDEESPLLRPIVNAAEEFFREARCLAQNIVLIGGGSQIPGLAERIESELTTLRPSFLWKVRVAEEPSLVSWKGASILTRDPWVEKQYIRREEYEEEGPHFVHRRCW